MMEVPLEGRASLIPRKPPTPKPPTEEEVIARLKSICACPDGAQLETGELERKLAATALSILRTLYEANASLSEQLAEVDGVLRRARES